MPKNKETHGEFLLRMTELFPKEFRVEKSFLFCLVCEQKVTAEKKFQVTQHLDGKSHKAKKGHGDKQKQSLLSDYAGPSKGPPLKEFSIDLCKMLIDTNIPIHKITHPSFIAFMEKYTRQTVPTDSNIRNSYLPVLYNLTIEKLRAKVAGKKYGCRWMRPPMLNVVWWQILLLEYWVTRTKMENHIS